MGKFDFTFWSTLDENKDLIIKQHWMDVFE